MILSSVCQLRKRLIGIVKTERSNIMISGRAVFNWFIWRSFLFYCLLHPRILKAIICLHLLIVFKIKKTIIEVKIDDCFLYFVKIRLFDFMVTFYFCLQTAWQESSKQCKWNRKDVPENRSSNTITLIQFRQHHMKQDQS